MKSDLNELHIKEVGLEPEVVAEVPDLIYFAGFFADYYKGHAVCSAGVRRLFVSVSRRKDNKVVVVNTRTGERGRFQINLLKHKKTDNYLDCIKGIFSELGKHNVKLCGFDIVLSGDILKACNLTLNSAAACGCLVSILKILDVSLNDECLARIAYNACCSFACTHCSYATIFGMLRAQEGHPILLNHGDKSYKYLDCPFTTSENALVLIDTGAVLDWLNAEIHEISNELKVTSDTFVKLTGKKSFANMSKLELAAVTARMPAEQKESFRYLVSEHFSGLNGLNILKNCMLNQLGPYLDKVYRALKTLLDLTFPECDWLIKRASELPGCTGAGICVSGDDVYVACVLKKESIHLLEEKREEYSRLFGTGCTIYRFLPSSGVKVS